MMLLIPRFCGQNNKVIGTIKCIGNIPLPYRIIKYEGFLLLFKWQSLI